MKCIQGSNCNCQHNKKGSCKNKPDPEQTCFGIVCMNMKTVNK